MATRPIGLVAEFAPDVSVGSVGVMALVTVAVVARLLLSLLLGGLIGLERELHGRPAGLRTHILVCLGSALTMVIGAEVRASAIGVSVDPTRMAANVVSGIGFLGAGTILREGVNVRGLTTAASLWVSAVIGLAAGAGTYISAVSTTALALLALGLMSWIERRLVGVKREHVVRVAVADRPGQIGRIGSVLGGLGVDIRNIRIVPGQDECVDVELILRLPQGQAVSVTTVAAALTDIEGVFSVEEQE